MEPSGRLAASCRRSPSRCRLMTMDDGSRARLEAARAGAGWALAELYHELHTRVLR